MTEERERERLCAHVRAAKDWLGRAESSLEKEEDIRGGLNLMLAEAEMQRAREARRKKSPARFLAPMLAVFLALGGIAFQRYAERTEVIVEKSPVASVGQGEPVHETEEEVALAERVETTMNLPEPQKSEQPVMSVRQDEIKGSTAEKYAAEAEPQHPPTALVQEEEAERIVSDPLPSKDMQKLMLSAGRVLRE